MRQPKPILLLTAALFFLGCSIKEPGSPKWQTEFTLPIADRVYVMEELVTDSSQVDTTQGNWVSNQNNTLYANFADSIEPVPVGNALNYNTFGDEVISHVGVRRVDSPGSQTSNIPASNLDNYSGQTIPVQPFDFPDPDPFTEDTLDPFTEYDWASVDSGTITITVTNNLSVPIDGLTIEIYEISALLPIATMNVTSFLASGASDSSTQDLPIDPYVIDNVFRIRLKDGHSPGSPSVLIHGNNNIAVTVGLSALYVTNAQAHVPAQPLAPVDSIITIEEQHTVKIATIKAGSVSYTVTNNTELISWVTFTMPDFKKNGQAYIDSTELFPGYPYTVTNRSLIGYQLYRPQGDNKIQAKVTSRILDTNYPPYSPTGFRIVNENQTVVTEYNVSELYFSYFEGTLNNAVVEIEQPAQILEGIPGGLESLDVQILYNHLILSNVINADVNVDLILKAYKGGLLQETYTFPNLLIPAGNVAFPGILNTTFTGDEALINLMPDSILSVGQVHITGDVAIYDTAWVEGTMHLYSPFSFIIGQSTLIPELTIIDQGFENQLQEVHLSISLENHAPLHGQVYVRASYDSNRFSNFLSNAVLDTFIVLDLPSATIEGGYVTAPGIATATQTLDSLQLEMFAGASQEQPLYIQTKVIINSSNGAVVHFRPDDYLTVGASAHVYVNVDFGK